MGILWFRKKTEHVMTDEMREQALETRRLQHQIKQLEKRLEMKSYLSELSGMVSGQGTSKDDQFLALLLPLLMGQRGLPPSDGSPSPPISPPSLSPENITKISTEINKKYPDVAHYVKNITDGDLIAIKEELKK